MKHVRTDLIPVLAILAGAAFGAIASGLIASSLSTFSPPGVVVVPASAMEAPVPPLMYIDDVRIGYDVGAPSLEAWRGGESTFTARAVRAALSEWFMMTGTSPLAIDGVESIDVLTSSEAIQRYGDDADGGMIRITLRHKDPQPPTPFELDLLRSPSPSYTEPPRVLNIGEVRRAMFASFPKAVRDGEFSGTAMVSFLINERGEVRETRLEVTSGHEPVDQAAMTVATVFRFSPALNGSTPVSTWFSRDLTFDVR